MKNHSFFMPISIILIVLLLTVPVTAAKISLTEGHVNGPGEATTLHLVMDEAPNGLAGYYINLSFDPQVGIITQVDFPSWAILKGAKGRFDGNEVLLSGVDLKKAVQNGSKNVELATITVKGLKQGSTVIHLEDEIIDDDAGHRMKPVFVDGSLTVGNVPVATYVPTTVAAAPGADAVPNNPAPATSSPAGVQPTSKSLYSAPGPVVPILGIVLCIIICAGGFLRRR